MNRSKKPLVAAIAATLVLTPTLTQLSADASSSAKAQVRKPAALLPALGEGLGFTSAFDSRLGLAPVAPSSTQRAALAGLGATVTWNVTGTPRSISKVGGALTGPSAQEPLAIAQSWLVDNADAFGLDASAMEGLALVRDHELPGVQARVLSFAQTFGGIASGYGGILTVLVDRDGRVVSYAGDPVRETALLGDFDLSLAEAVGTTVKDLLPGLDFVAKALGRKQGGYDVFQAGPLADVVRVRQIAFPTAQGGRAAYAVLVVKSIDEAWAVIVDAATGRPLLRKSLVAHAEGTIYENYPGAKKGGKPKVVSFGPTKQSPGGWVDPTGLLGLPGVTTFGNNANTAIAWTVPLVAADQENRPIAPTGAFNFAFPDAWRKSDGGTGTFVQDANAAAVNLFYHHNRIHDEFYEFGFTESAGNFQLVNNGEDGLGLGGDPIMGGAQSGALNLTEPVLPLGRNNANMLTLPDGIPGFTNMYLWEFADDAFEGAARDGDFDSTIIEHEYAHGLSNRYVGGGGLGSLGTGQSGAMGEGWGDWFAMNHLFREGLTRTAVTAPYVGDPQRGIRNWNYATSPATYGDYGYDMSGPEVHSDGEIWTATLWTLRTKILKAVGGNHRKASDIAEHLVMDAMPISPATPTFLDMRDAILKASELRYKNRYTDLIWSAFAERGMGVSARTTGETDTDPKPGFDVPKKALNGKVTLKLVNASAGGAASKVRVLGGLYEGRGTPLVTTNGKGLGTITMAAGRHTLTLQGAGYGIQRITVDVPKGRAVTKVVQLRPNLLSQSSGATVVRTTSQTGALPGSNMVDDTEATAWQTGASDKAYNNGPDRSVTVKLKKLSTIETVAVSVVKPIGLPRFAAARTVLVQTSLDGKKWRTAKVATFSFKGPRPAIADLDLQTYQLKTPVKARFVRAVAAANFGSAPTNASTAIVSEVQAFGQASGIKPKLPPADKPVTSSGSVNVGNPVQGSLLGLEPYKPGVTELSWSCPDLPSANGVDAFMTKLPAGAGDGLHAATYTGDVAIGEFLVYAYDEDCQPMSGGFALFDEATPIPAGAAYLGFLLLYGGGASFDVTVTEPR
ncbi:M36 family metallopeptidase [Nocardioides psychrotolerans]|uniref:M36 family metallopeptidase n=1 Tax=Nocardioides psychrotolerans TaxID=1005945 RepID=UPI003137CC50